MNIDAKICNKILAIYKIIIYHDQVGLSQECKVGLIFKIKIIYCINRTGGKKQSFQWVQKKHLENSTRICSLKTIFQQTRSRKDLDVYKKPLS